jgi:hypothetical protein
MSPDSNDIWNQVKSGIYYNWHPVFYTWFVKLTSLNGTSPAFTAIVQTVILNMTIYLLIAQFLPGISQSRRFAYVAMIEFLPFVGAMGVALWKDVVYTELSLIGLLLILKNIKRFEARFVLGIVVLIFGTLCRHEAWAIIFILAILCFVKSILSKETASKRLSLKLGACLLAVAMVSHSLDLFVNSTMHIAQPPKIMARVGLLADLEYVATTQPDLLIPSDLKLLNQISQGRSALGAKTCTNPNGLIPNGANSGFNSGLASLHAGDLISMWLRNWSHGAGAPLVFAHLCRVQAFIPPFFASPPTYIEWMTFGINTTNDNNYHLKSWRPIPIITSAAESLYMFFNFNSAVLGWPALYLLIILILYGYLRFRNSKRNASLDILVAFLTIRDLLLITVGNSQDFRYMFAVYLVAPILILRFFHIKIGVLKEPGDMKSG